MSPGLRGPDENMKEYVFLKIRNSKMTRIFVHFVLMTLSICLLLGCGGNDQTETNNPAPQSQVQNQQANLTASQKFEFTSYDLDGNLHSSTEWIGKQPVVINVWGTWCPPCRKEIPDLVKLYNEYRHKNVEMLGLTISKNPRETPEMVKLYAEKNGMEWVLLLGDQRSLMSIRMGGGIPTTIFIDKNGKEVERFIGARSYEQFKAAFEKIL